jgi:pyridoxal phosphate enzyme (YggS family)
VKSLPFERIQEAADAGLSNLAQNRVQEAEATIRNIVGSIRWHMVGHLQRNKAPRAAELFDRIHTVDRLELAAALSRRAEALGRRIPVLAQVNVSGETTKHGVAPDELEALLQGVVGLAGLALDGLMSIGAPVENGQTARPYFARTRELRDRAERRLGIALPELSMGMSADFETAIEEGSTMVRVGTALFGSRPLE